MLICPIEDMNTTTGKAILHFSFMLGITALITSCMIYPFLPGAYDDLAVALSNMAQASGVVGLMLVPIGITWLMYAIWRQKRSRQNRPIKMREHYFALAAVVITSFDIAAIAFIGVVSTGWSLGLATLLTWLYIVSRLIPKIKLLRASEDPRFNLIPLYLIFTPIAVLLLQILLATPLTKASRNHAIATSAELINAIEAYRTSNGYYPTSLLATWPDYSPDVVGIEQYHYMAQGDSYNLFFQQPRFLLDDIGVREFVVYNPLDEHMMISHTSWILLLRPAELRRSQGWYAVRHDPTPHWRYFWFD